MLLYISNACFTKHSGYDILEYEWYLTLSYIYFICYMSCLSLVWYFLLQKFALFSLQERSIISRRFKFLREIRASAQLIVVCLNKHRFCDQHHTAYMYRGASLRNTESRCPWNNRHPCLRCLHCRLGEMPRLCLEIFHIKIKFASNHLLD